MSKSQSFTKIILETGLDGRSRWREEPLLLHERKLGLFLSDAQNGGNVQLRYSPVGYCMDFHPTANPQWTFVLSGSLEIGLQDGSARVFQKGDFFFSEDTVPVGMTFDPNLHGHNSRQLGNEPVVTALIRT